MAPSTNARRSPRVRRAQSRRPAKLRRRAGIRWDRVARTALLVVLGVIVLLYVPPVSHWIEQSETAAHQRAELEALRQEHEELEDRKASLSGPEAVEREARRLGMVREGERAFVIENLPAP